MIRLKNEVYERSVMILQLKQRIVDLEKVSGGGGGPAGTNSGTASGANTSRAHLESVQLKLVNADHQIDALRGELQRVIKQRDLQVQFNFPAEMGDFDVAEVIIKRFQIDGLSRLMECS